MFGILFFLFIALCGGAAAILKCIDDSKVYPHTKNSFDGYYIDSRGAHRELGTGNTVMILTDDYGDEIMYTTKGKVIKNITENRRHKFTETIQKAIHEGRTNQTAYWCDLREYHENKWANIKGPRYKDASNGNVYVVRSFDIDGLKHKKTNRISGMEETIATKHMIGFYMDINNGHLVRPTDGCIRLNEEYDTFTEKEFLKNNIDVIQMFISDFNNKQENDINNKGVDEFEDHYFFNINDYKEDFKMCDTFLDSQWNDFNKYNGDLKLEKGEIEATWTH